MERTKPKRIAYNKKYFTIDDILKESITCKTKVEFIKKYPGACAAAKKMGIYDVVCQHMVVKNYSTPQLILKQILEELLNEKCKYSDRKLIKPYELDILFEKYKLAFEYDGERWHRNDIIDKELLCNNKGFLLIKIKENNRNYEIDIKNQIINNLHLINKWTKKKITVDNVNDFIVNYEILIPDLKDVKNICLLYSDFSMFRSEQPFIFNLLNRYKLSSVFTSHMHKKRNNNFDIENVKELIRNHNGNIASFSKRYGWIYIQIRRRKLAYLLEPLRTLKLWDYESIIKEIAKYDFLSDFMQNSKGCYMAIQRLGLNNLLENLKKKRQSYKSYTIEYVEKVISKYQILKDFINGKDSAVYAYCYKNNGNYI